MTTSGNRKTERLIDLLGEVKLLAREYYELTGRPLGAPSEAWLRRLHLLD